MADIDIEAANRLRVAMGLKPIEMPGSGPTFKASNGASDDEDPASTVETRQAAAGDNWDKYLNETESKKKRLAQKEAIKKARDAAMRDAKMTGKTLGADDEEQDTSTWLRQQNKRQKKIEKARKLEAELAAREKMAEYTEKDLAGVKVAHEIGQFDAGSEQILTLKDAIIGEESEDDELENIDMRASEQLKEKLELKKRKPVYDPTNEDGSGNILAHYDEEIDGKKQNQFTLDGFGSTKEHATVQAENGSKNKGVVISLDFLKDDIPISDYVEASEIKMKKPKKKKSKSSKKKTRDDDDEIIPAADNAMDLDTKAAPAKKRSYDEANFVDDDDLQTRLAHQRREALKKKKRMRPEDMARQMREEAENEMEVTVEDDEDGPGLVLDETSEFVNHLDAPEDREEENQTRVRRSKSAKPTDSDSDSEMEDAASPAKAEQTDENASKAPEEDDRVGLEEESNLSRGLGSTIALLRQRKHLASAENDDLAQNYRGYEEFLGKKRAREDDAERKARQQREHDRASGHLERMSVRDREEYARQNNTRREQQESRAMSDLYNKEYKPNVELKYTDEFGRSMNAKEAFKHLSHQFHGKGSGKQKHEKRLKKIEEERKRESASTLDSSQHVSSAAMGNKAKRNQQAGVRLQ
ncbi:SART-1 family protein [Microthyrium microscopicum]|uniref:SART-1 family protein n=1 Tax=Microthyrium microscopicum TaxID=703497 RepID=A0A6A6U909_9PEZI|nr:SART-1 family protein [Microthyrium microscopicum]